jgi:DNA-binding SARP family transcriptional activator
MDIRVLGPLEATEKGGSVMPTADKPRQILALLALNAGEMVTTANLMEELWGDRAPRAAVTTIQTYIMRLRQLIAERSTAGPPDAAKKVLLTRSGGYTLDMPSTGVDAHRYVLLAAVGDRAMDAGDYETASAAFGKALSCWRGPVLVDVTTGPRLGIEVARLTQSRISVQVSYIEAELRLRRYNQLLSQLAELTARYPLHEKLCAQYMTALDASGCKWRALEVYQKLRRSLVDELGIEPSAWVQRLHRAILNSETVQHAPYLGLAAS